MIKKSKFVGLWNMPLGITLLAIFGAPVWISAQDKKADDGYAKAGNVPPRIEKLSPEVEKEILKDVTLPAGFTATLFADAKAANYPVYVAAAPNGDLYVASDGNGSLGRNPKRGRVLRLRDTDKDGRADQVTEFVKDLDSPRGMVWDNDRLYVIHPPDVSVFIDRDADGMSDEQKTLIKEIAFGFKDRPADHTTNGLSLGIDGWLYIAGGDFGFMDAVGTDGRHLQHRAGGVIRFRPDGSGLEIFATGTRNILGTPISPLLEIYSRDNTNDGGGWDVRFHHFTGLEDHGYPRIYKNFAAEHVLPLADYGGGSGCGSVYICEPGFPAEWNDAPFTCDWGTSGLWRHTVRPKGATAEETAPPKKLIAMTRPTDADVDGMSAVYQASWKGATFDWNGAEVGYIVRVTPTGYQPEPLPNFEKLSDAELVSLLESPSQVRTMEAQRALLRRPENADTTKAILALAANGSKPLPARVAALYAISQRAVASTESARICALLAPLASDAALQRFVLRAMGDAGLDRLSEGKPIAPVTVFDAGLKSPDPRTRLEAIVGATRQHMLSLAPAIAECLGDSDLVLAHTAFRGLGMLHGSQAAFSVIDNPHTPAARKIGAGYALMRMHSADVVAGVVDRLTREKDPVARKVLISVLCRLHHTEAEWKGDSWGTRPDTRGPYYQPGPWAETERIAQALKAMLGQLPPDEAAYLVSEMNRNRIQSNEALDRIIVLAAKDPKLNADAVAQMGNAEQIPAAGIPVLLQAAKDPTSSAATLAGTIAALAKTDEPQALSAMLAALISLDATKGSNKDQEAGTNAFLNAPKLENLHQNLEHEAEAVGSKTALWADAALLTLSARKGGSPESREMSGKALAKGWEDPKRRVQIIRAAEKIKSHALDVKILAAENDPDATVAKAAKAAVKTLRIQAKKDDSPKVAKLKPEEVLAAVLKIKGDPDIGEQVFTRATCVACHTVNQSQAQKGPYLGNIAQTYKRPDLAMNVLDPNRTIAQGFATNMITLKDGAVHVGFVTDESGDKVTIRNIAAQEFTFGKAQIAERGGLPTSMMPAGLLNDFTVNEFAGLLAYLEKLAKP